MDEVRPRLFPVRPECDSVEQVHGRQRVRHQRVDCSVRDTVGENIQLA